MATVFGLDTDDVRAESKRRVSALGGAICEWLPWLDRTEPRTQGDLVDRTAIMSALVQIHFGAPVSYVRSWIESNNLSAALSEREREILNREDDAVSEQESTDLYWYIEALWALAWVGSLVTDIPVEKSVGDELASLMPDLHANESPERLRQSFILRPPDEIYRKLDLYYLAHWYARDGSLRGKDTAPFSLDIIMERRKALEWALDSSIPDWDETPQDT